uniref:Uncharacterized protein n=1 Tax=Setaria italica TaxID=4555 RepID=K3XTS6_SETIT
MSVGKFPLLLPVAVWHHQTLCGCVCIPGNCGLLSSEKR